MARYQSIKQVPRRWQTLQGVQLTLEQIEDIIASAEESDKPFAIAIVEAREGFQAVHKVVANRWVSKV